MSLTKTLKKLVTRRQAARTDRRQRRVELFRELGNVGGIERLEDRQLLATVSASGSTLTIGLDVASQIVSVAATATTYTFTLSGLFTNTWSGSAPTDTTISTTTLTVNNKATYSTINISNTSSGAGITFGDSGANTFDSSITATLNSTAATNLTFTGATSFSGSNAISITTAKGMSFNSRAIAP